jgi:hypothetical protein
VHKFLIGALAVGFLVGVVCSQLFVGVVQSREAKIDVLRAMCFHYAGIVGDPSVVLYGIGNFTVLCEGNYLGTNWTAFASLQ